MKSLKYRCGRCGKQAVLGQHFCRDADVRKFEATRDYEPDADLGYDAVESADSDPADSADSAEPREPLKISEHTYAAGAVVGAILLAVFLYQTIGSFTMYVVIVVGLVVLVAIYRKKIAAALFDHYQELVGLCRGDASLADRLILGEMNRNGSLDRKAAIQKAIDRIIADRAR